VWYAPIIVTLAVKLGPSWSLLFALFAAGAQSNGPNRPNRPSGSSSIALSPHSHRLSAANEQQAKSSQKSSQIKSSNIVDSIALLVGRGQPIITRHRPAENSGWLADSSV